jgi:hypothetical protein
VPICNRVVLDANCVRGSPRAELKALVGRGYRLSLSVEGLREVWSKSIRERKPEQLINRLQALGPFIDCLEPIAFTGSALLGQLVDLPADVAGEAADFRNRINYETKHSLTRHGLPSVAT